MSARRLPSLILAGALVLLGGGPAAASAPGQRHHPVTVFVAGDSTAAVWPADVAPKAGWGQALGAFLDPRRVRVDDRALSGASSKSFVEAGLLDDILADIRPNDYLLISFGHNDEKSDDRHTDPYTSYQQYLSLFIDGARRHHAKPVLVTPVERRRFNADGRATASHGEYPAAMLALGVAGRVPTVDLTRLSMLLWDRVGVQATKDYFLWLDPGENANFPDGVADNTHFQAHGAIELARIVVGQLAHLDVLPRRAAIRLHQPVPDDALEWPASVPV